MIMGIEDYGLAHHSRSMSPIRYYRSSWCHNNWCSQLGLRYCAPSLDYCRYLRFQGYENSLLFQIHPRRSGQIPFGSMCVGRWHVCLPLRHPIPPSLHGWLSVWTTLLANTLPMCHHQNSSTNSLLSDPSKWGWWCHIDWHHKMRWGKWQLQ